MDVDKVIDKVIDIINNKHGPFKEIVLKGYGIDEEDLYVSSSIDAAIAREELDELKHNIYLDALDEYNKSVDDEDRIAYWDCSDDSLEIIERLYEYVEERFEVIIEK